jgi:hypothetical protein
LLKSESIEEPKDSCQIVLEENDDQQIGLVKYCEQSAVKGLQYLEYFGNNSSKAVCLLTFVVVPNAEEDYIHFTKYKCHLILDFERGYGPIKKSM